MQEIYTVSEFNTISNNLLQNTFSKINVKGEISECSQSKMGAIYFSLCDDESSISCVIFKNQYTLLGFELEEGMRVVVNATASVYKKRGTFQLVVSSIKKDGKGSILEKIAENNEKWKGTYFARPKRKIPKAIENLFVITSDSGEVIHDIIRTRNIRNKSANIFIFPAIVQGERCPGSISNAVYYANSLMKKLVSNPEINKYSFTYENTCIIVARGGGSFDDLLPFYDEEIVKSFSQSELVIISAIGHDQNCPSCNFACDTYVSTPTQAVEVALMDKEGERKHFFTLKRTLEYNANRILEYNIQNYDNIKNILDMSLENIKISLEKKLTTMRSQLLLSLNNKFEKEKSKFVYLKDSITNKCNEKYDKEVLSFEHLKKSLVQVSPKNVLKRGYSVLENDKGNVINSVNDIKNGSYKLILSDGKSDINITRQ